ncbi:hypothetical protein [Absidia glauca]|uniref:RNA-directed DNA polymerase n=1 Tax=Absidia glauca TaxID=4829 RepID=A0A163JDA0_ABSGL|nr:hypothetical protein [Absidia glauca]
MPSVDIIETTAQATRLAQEKLQESVQELTQLMIANAKGKVPMKAFKDNEAKQNLWKTTLLNLNGLGPMLKKEIKVPTNLPVLQLVSDKEINDKHPAFEMIDNFLEMFTIIMHQHHLDLNQHWETCIISSLQHSTTKCSWFKENLMAKGLSWQQAQETIKHQFGGAQTQSYYLEKLNSMESDRHENPVHFVERFSTCLHRAQVEDSVAYGSMLIRGLTKHHRSLVKQIKATHAATDPTYNLSINVAYVARVVPLLYIEDFDNDRNNRATRRATRFNNGSDTNRHDYPNSNYSNTNYANNRGRGRNNYRGRARHYQNGRGYVSNNRNNSSNSNSNTTPTFEECKAKGICFHCRSKWTVGHKCQQYMEKFGGKTDYTPFKQRLARLEHQIKTQEAVLAMRDIDLNKDGNMDTEEECKRKKSRMAKIENELNPDSFVVPIQIESHRTFALLDSGANFSSLDRTFILNKQISFSSINGNIQLADNHYSTKRIGKTNALNVTYNSKAHKISFEVMDLPKNESYTCVIGTDYFQKLGIFLVGLATSYDDTAPLQFDDERKDIPKPDESPAGTALEQKLFYQAIKNSVTNNQKVDKRSFCTVPESIVTLDTPAGKTCYKRQYPIANNLMPLIDEAVTKWLNEGTIVRAGVNTEWNSPLTLAPKKDADGNKSRKRPCLDPRHINLLLPNDRFPLPLIKDIFETLKGATVFTTLDLQNAFHRFQIAPADQHKTTFTHRGTQYMFQGCPFGLKPLSSKFQRVTNMILEDMPFATSFIDDIVVYSANINDHAKHVQQVINKLTSVNLILNPDKCHFAQQSVYLLGFCVSVKGLSLDTRKVTNVQKWPTPKTGNDIERFLGVINYFRDHIPKVSTLTAPLDRLRKEKKLGNKWTPVCDTVFIKLKYVLTCTTVLKHPNLQLPFNVATDASNTGIGAVLFQVVNKKVQHIGFFARSLSKSERNYSTTKRELLAIIFALNKFHKYLWGNHFTLYTDHRALIYIHTQRIANPMMIQWLDTILQYNFTVAHVPGMSNILPDALSRLFPIENKLVGDIDTLPARKIAYKEAKMEKLVNQHNDDLIIPDKDDRDKLIQHYHRSAHIQQPEEEQLRTVNGDEERKTIMEKQHALGHNGATAMIKAIQADGMTWPNLKADAVQHVSKCNACMQYNVARKGYNPLSSITSRLPGDHWAVDLAGPLEETHKGNVYILVMIDICTKFVIIKAIPDKTSLTIAESLIDVFSTFGYPKIIQSDNGTEFVNKIIKKITEVACIDHRLISAYHPRANGAAERTVQTVKGAIQKHMEGQSKDWDHYIPTAQLAINARIVRLTNSAPFSLMFARKLNAFVDHTKTTITEDNKAVMDRIEDMKNIVMPAIIQRTTELRELTQNKFNSKHKMIEFKIGTLVNIKKPTYTKQLEPKYKGPFKVVRKNKGGAYTLQHLDGELLDRNYPPSALKSVSDDLITNEEDRWEVDTIVDHRGIPGKYEYLVRWKGYTKESDTWEPPSMFDDIQTIKNYWSKRQGALMESSQLHKKRKTNL